MVYGFLKSDVIQRSFVMFFLLVVFLWIVGFVNFLMAIPADVPKDGVKSDAIVVLTGGSKRLEAGIVLLEQGKAELLFVSGVNEKVTSSDILHLVDRGKILKSDQLFSCCIKLGYAAEDTTGNAKESLEWLRINSLGSIILVTSNYHMQRAYLEFKLQNSNVRITKYPVISSDFTVSDWIINPRRFALLFLEYHKLILTSLRAYC